MNRKHILQLIAFLCGVGIVVTVALISETLLPVVIVTLLALCIFILFLFYGPFAGTTSEGSGSCETQLKDASEQLRFAQEKLMGQEKMASIGMLTAGIAHEIKNPLNFINNFSDMTVEMLEELKTELEKMPTSTPTDLTESMTATIDDIATNCRKINEHGKRAESIIKNMLIQSRSMKGEKTDCNVNALLDEYINLAYHGMRAHNSKFNAKIDKEFDPTLPTVTASPQSMGRVFLNIINNAFYALNEKNEHLTKSHATYMPTLTVITSQDQTQVIIKIRDNGTGIPNDIRDKIFDPFFTTKPSGEGTGLGLSICYDIVVKEHGGKLEIVTSPDEFTEFILMLPKDKTAER